MVFQSYALYLHMTVRENIGFGLKVRKLPRDEIERRVVEAAGILGIGDLLDRRPRELSGGQRQRVALGRAITRRPKVFLLDEPLSNLDAQLRTLMRAELKILFDRLQGTVVFVTHDQAEAMTLSDRLVVMRHGLVQQVGTPIEVYNRPNNMFVASFLGSPGMNFIPCEIRATEDQVQLSAPNFSWALGGAKGRLATGTAGRAAIFGARPEDIRIERGVRAAGVRCRVEVLEPMGSLNIVYVTTGSSRIVVTTPPDFEAQAGEQVWLTFDNAKAHLFDQASERNLTLEAV
jgi:multiple sugar transport system ATP-binding protein